MEAEKKTYRIVVEATFDDLLSIERAILQGLQEKNIQGKIVESKEVRGIDIVILRQAIDVVIEEDVRISRDDKKRRKTRVENLLKRSELIQEDQIPDIVIECILAAKDGFNLANCLKEKGWFKKTGVETSVKQGRVNDIGEQALDILKRAIQRVLL